LSITNSSVAGSYYTSVSSTGTPQQPCDVTYMPAGVSNTVKYLNTIQAYSGSNTYSVLCYSDAGVTGTINNGTGPTGSYLSLTRIA
jgi:hypothetical protein